MPIRTSLLLFVLPLIAAAPAPFEHWSAATLKSYDEKFAGQEVAAQQLGSYPLQAAVVRHREASAGAEAHQHAADWLVIQTGAGTLLLGGTIANAKTESPGELRGEAIVGGTRQSLAPGDIVFVPAGTPHQFLLEKGQKITYFALKVQGQ